MLKDCVTNNFRTSWQKERKKRNERTWTL